MVFTNFSDRWLDWGLIAAQILILFLAWWFVRRKKLTLAVLGWLLISALAVQLAFHILTYGLTWWYYAHDATGKYLAPPHDQFLLHRAIGSLTTIIINWVMTVGVFGTLWWIFIKRTKGALLDQVDVILLTLAVAVIGWPGWLVLFTIIFVLAIIGMLTLIIIRKKRLSDRLIVTPYIIPAAILTALFKVFILDWTGLIKIRF